MKNIELNKISVIGAVRSGIGAAKLVKKLGGIPFVSDGGSKEKLTETARILSEAGIEFEFGSHSDKVYDCDMIITSPGVPSDSEVLLKARQKGIKIISELEFAASFCKGKIISITGTNGKTTTTTLCAYVLEECGFKVYSAGNIGLAFSEIAMEVKENEYVALETSSFQLDHVDEFKPYISVILNITPDHLDRYENSFEKYKDSKMNIFRNQTKFEYTILNADDDNLNTLKLQNDLKPFYFSLNKPVEDGCTVEGSNVVFYRSGKKEFQCSVKDVSIPGEHNLANAMAVIIITKILNAENGKIISALRTFKGVEHRLELVRELDGVKYINDSKATNVDSVWYALRSFDNPIFLILGGKDKGNDYSKIADLVASKVKKIYAIGSSADKVFNYFHRDVKVEVKQSLQECISAANKEARENEVVLLSPACASFDMFDNYEHRGKVFKDAVNNL